MLSLLPAAVVVVTLVSTARTAASNGGGRASTTYSNGRLEYTVTVLERNGQHSEQFGVAVERSQVQQLVVRDHAP